MACGTCGSDNVSRDAGMRVMEAWGFRYVSNIVWHKVRKDGGSDGRGVGFYFRNVTELLLFGTRGKNARTLAPGVIRQLLSISHDAPTCLNVNFPDCDASAAGPLTVTRQGVGLVEGIDVVPMVDPRGIDYHWLRFQRGPRPNSPGFWRSADSAFAAWPMSPSPWSAWWSIWRRPTPTGCRPARPGRRRWRASHYRDSRSPPLTPRCRRS